MRSTEHNPIRLVGCSVRGPGHIEDGIPCQDSWTGDVVSEDKLAIAVGDGLGEADLSHEGSKVATCKAIDVLKQYLKSTDEVDRDSAQEALRNSFTQARAAVREEAEQLDEPPSELQTTLLAIIAGPFGIAGAAVGDGGIVYEQGDTYSLLVEREMAVVNLSASHKTFPLIDDEWPSYRFGFSESCEGVVVFSDGVENFAWSGLESANAEFFDGVFEVVREIQDTETATQKLEDILSNNRFKDIDDDKTVAVGDFLPNVRTDEIQTTTEDQVAVGEVVETDKKSATYRTNESDDDFLKLYRIKGPEVEKKRNKIREMTEFPPEHRTNSEPVPSFAWPTDIVENREKNHFLGYRMSLPSYRDGSNILHFAEEYQPQVTHPDRGFVDRLLETVGITGKDKNADTRYRYALALAKGVSALHQQGHAIGNFHHSKIFIGDKGVIFTECDGFYIRGDNKSYEGNSPSQRYTHPEDKSDRIEAVQLSDLFALAIHIFQLFMNGFHPFRATGSESTGGEFGEMIRENPFPYRDPQQGLLEPPENAPSYHALSSELREYFEICFIEGKTIPNLRPSASTWVEGLESN